MANNNKSSNARKRARKKALREAKKREQISKNEGSNVNSKTNNVKTNHKRKRNEVNANVDSDDEEDEDLLALAHTWASNATDNSDKSTSNTNNCNTKNKNSENTMPTPKKKLANKSRQLERKPLPFPPNLPVPHNDFLRDKEPFREAFQAAINTAYEGLVWEPANNSHELALRRALTIMDDADLFRTDVTQPAGLGSKLVPSYVTRCLLGDEGTTYRYLGLRMFAHPWNGSAQMDNNTLKNALITFQSLNQRLSTRTKEHLSKLRDKRQERGEVPSLTCGPTTFNVTLINKMTTHRRLREEPMFQSSKYSVGWHADSSLEHFSTIAVYHTLIESTTATSSTSTRGENKSKKRKRRKTLQADKDSDNDEWAVALRVTHDAEGPRAKRLGDISVETGSPPIAVSLPSGSTYFMLDDYNHHHQHAVLAPHNNTMITIRYSSTHRLLRQGHTVQDMLARCERVLAHSRNHGPKRWRSEQLLLNELENEWLRQFFIQGSEHKRLLWGYWEKPISHLLDYWQKLEERTLEVTTLLRNAALARNNISVKDGTSAAALATLIQVQGDRKNAYDSIYNPMANLLLERAKSRELWTKREKDKIFQQLPKQCRPIPFPVAYGVAKKTGGESVIAHSPLQEGSSTFLTELASQIQAWGRSYDTRNSTYLPEEDLLDA